MSTAANGDDAAPVIQKVAPGEFKGDLRDLPPMKPYLGPRKGVNPRPRPAVRPKNYVAPSRVDPLLKTLRKRSGNESLEANLSARPFESPLVSFEGQSNDDVSNPDTVGDVGPNRYIQMVNAGESTSFKIYDKSGNVLVDSTLLSSLAPAGSRCATGTGDPIVLYDHLEKRWLMGEIASPVQGQPNFFCTYISKGRNPETSGWWAYQFQTVGFPDYPKYGTWSNAYFVGANETGGPTGDVASAYALDKEKMLRGQPATAIRFAADQLPGFSGFNAMLPADLDGTAPPAGSPGYFVRHVDEEFHFGFNKPRKDFLEVYMLQPDFDSPGNSEFRRLRKVRIADFDSSICDSGAALCIQQPDSSQGLDSIPEMIMWRVQYRNLNGTGMLIGSFTVDATGQDQAGIRWFVLKKKAGRPGWKVDQQGTHAPDDGSRWMGSIAMDKCGNLALGYSHASDDDFPGIRYAGRMPGDPRGAMPHGENSIIEGGAAYEDFNRWGDYTSMNVDPTNDRTFWYTNQYVDEDGRWRTWIASFEFDGCSG